MQKHMKMMKMDDMAMVMMMMIASNEEKRNLNNWLLMHNAHFAFRLCFIRFVFLVRSCCIW